MPVQKRGGKALTLRIVAAAFSGAVRGDEDPLDGASGDVVNPDLESAHTWSEGVPLDCKYRRVARLGGDVQDRLPKL